MEHDILEEKTDTELVVLARDDAAFFGVLMQRYEAPLLRYIHRLLSVTHEDAEDVLQESFVKAYQNLNDFDTELSFSSWMYRIVHNTAISTWRKAKVRPHGNTIDVDDTFWLRIASEENVQTDMDRSIDASRIAQVFGEMDEKYRSVLILYFLEEKTYKEISDILKKPMGTVATLVNRAKKQFRAACSKQGISFE